MSDKKISLDKAAEAFVILIDGNNYSQSEFDVCLTALREALNKDTTNRSTPVVPEDDGEEEVAEPETPAEFVERVIEMREDELDTETPDEKKAAAEKKAKAAKKAAADKQAAAEKAAADKRAAALTRAPFKS